MGACSPGGAGGSGGGSGKTGSGGALGTGGTSGTGGTNGSGGAPNGGSGGATQTGGSSGSGGAAGSGGMTAASGGITAGSGGIADTGGNSGSGGGGAPGSGGVAGAGGKPTAGNGGAAGGGPMDGGIADVVVHDGPTMSGGAYVRTGWTATYMCTGTCPAPKDPSMDMSDPDTGRAFDTSTSTRWSTRNYQQFIMAAFPLYFTFDMKEVNIVSRITTAAGGDPYDAPGEMDVLVSLDGTNFTVAITAHQPVSPSKGTMDTIMFPQPTPARYIQLKATKTIKQVDSKLGDRFWAIADLNVYP